MTNGNNQYAPNGDEGHGVKADDMFSGTYENNFNAYSTYDASYVDGICDAPSFNIHVDNSSNTANDNTPSTSYPSSAYSSSNNASFSTNDMYNAPAYAGQNNVGGSFGVLRSSPSPVLSASNFGNFDHNDYQVVYSSFNGLGNDENTYPVSSVGAFIPEFFGDEAIV
jgi:hypothetical protein